MNVATKNHHDPQQYSNFDDHPVLNDISFTLAEGEMIFLTGISGSGQSVLLRLAMGLLKPGLRSNLCGGTRNREAQCLIL